jgi:CCR4-NOT transcription complex subunit 7/8
MRSGIDFAKNEEYGIDVSDFGELLMSSGIVLNDEIKWISFHSGYDFGYLLKVLTCKPLPAEESEFFEQVRTYFPCIYDVKFLMKSCKNLKGGLNDLAEDLKVTFTLYSLRFLCIPFYLFANSRIVHISFRFFVIDK